MPSRPCVRCIGRHQMWAWRATFIMRPISASYVHYYTCSRYLQRYTQIMHTQQIAWFRKARCSVLVCTYTWVIKRRYELTRGIGWGGFTASVMRACVFAGVCKWVCVCVCVCACVCLWCACAVYFVDDHVQKHCVWKYTTRRWSRSVVQEGSPEILW